MEKLHRHALDGAIPTPNTGETIDACSRMYHLDPGLAFYRARRWVAWYGGTCLG